MKDGKLAIICRRNTFSSIFNTSIPVPSVRDLFKKTLKSSDICDIRLLFKRKIMF